jgi:hypothetical protein
MMSIAWALEWGYWIFTFGKKAPRLTRARVKYTTMQRTLDITKAKERLGYRPESACRKVSIDLRSGFLNRVPDAPGAKIDRNVRKFLLWRRTYIR